MRPRAAHCCGRGARQFAEIGYEVGLPALRYSFDRGFLQGRHWARIGAADDTGAEGVCVPGVLDAARGGWDGREDNLDSSTFSLQMVSSTGA